MAERSYLDEARDEAFDLALYRALAARADDDESRALLGELAREERTHLGFWCRLAGVDEASVRPSRLKLWFTLAAARLLGNTFTVRFVERREEETIAHYERILAADAMSEADAAELRRIIDSERSHERGLERRLPDERVRYLGAAVLGLNDALVELTGALTGLVSSISDTRLIGFTAFVVGFAASLSMAASNFLSEGMSDDPDLRPGKAATYTGVAYILVVIGLVVPFFLLAERVVALAISWVLAILVIVAFAYYSAVLQDVSFRRRAGQMLLLGLGVAVLSFGIGRALSAWVGVEV
jgi:VIT1/CCC1 family predicted Fe2+/Mn2+ transporter